MECFLQASIGFREVTRPLSSETVHTDPERQSNKLNQAKCGSKAFTHIALVPVHLVRRCTGYWY